jgi:hypothetical protein
MPFSLTSCPEVLAESDLRDREVLANIRELKVAIADAHGLVPPAKLLTSDCKRITGTGTSIRAFL